MMLIQDKASETKSSHEISLPQSQVTSTVLTEGISAEDKGFVGSLLLNKFNSVLLFCKIIQKLPGHCHYVVRSAISAHVHKL